MAHVATDVFRFSSSDGRAGRVFSRNTLAHAPFQSYNVTANAGVVVRGGGSERRWGTVRLREQEAKFKS